MTIRIKTWAAMAFEYGLTEYGNIETILFNKQMENILPTNREIVVHKEKNGLVWETTEHSYLIVPEMIDTREKISIAETNLVSNRKLIKNAYLEPLVKVNGVVTWDMSVSFDEEEIEQMLLDAIDKKINRLNGNYTK